MKELLAGGAVLWALVLLVLALAILPAATTSTAWYLRVGVPEIGAALYLLSAPAVYLIYRERPRLALGLGFALTVGYGWPWGQALLVRHQLPAALERAFPGASSARDPLRLGVSLATESRTEEYRPGLSWDRYRPVEGAVRARILFLHGGSWARGTRGDYPGWMHYLAGRGYEVVSASYRLAPEFPFPAARDDVDAALAKLAGEGLPVFVLGRSAGGHLGALAAYRNPGKVAGLISFYAPADMHFSWANPSHPRVLDSFNILRQFLGGSPEEAAGKYDAASPVRFVDERAPPTLLIHGARDSMVSPRQAGLFENALKKHQVSHHVLRLPWLEHGGDVFLRGPTSRLSAWAVEAFLEWRLASASGPGKVTQPGR